MKRRLVIGLVAVGCGLFTTASVQGPVATLLIEVEELRNSEGSVRVALFVSADGYPEDISKAARTRSQRTVSPKMRMKIAGLRPGTYALSLLHDENGNGRLDKNFLGIPLEGIGASNDAARGLGPPTFDAAKFEIAEGDNALTVRVHYWL